MSVFFGSWLLDEITRSLGHEACLRLVTGLGGKNVYVPSKPTDRLISKVGEDVANWLCEVRGNETISVPSANSVERSQLATMRRNVIESSDKSASDLAHMLGISTRHVRNIRRNIRDAQASSRARNTSPNNSGRRPQIKGKS